MNSKDLLPANDLICPKSQMLLDAAAALGKPVKNIKLGKIPKIKKGA